MVSLAARALGYGIQLSPAQQEQFETYYRLLSEWNARFNLTAITAYDDVQRKHFLDSLTAAPLLQAASPEGKRLLDVGSGAGLPGVPLAIVFPSLRVTLLEATGKKVQFLNALVGALGLANTDVVPGRAEEMARTPQGREQYDLVTARAVAPLRTLVEYTLPLARVGGMVVAYKATEAEAETNGARRAIDKLGGRVRAIVPVTLGDAAETRRLVVIDKVKPTPVQYPRAGGLPKNKPL